MNRIKWFAVIAIVLCVGTQIFADTIFSTGYSENKDLKIAGKEAALKAKEALNGQRAKVVIVSAIVGDESKQVDLSGVFEVFDKSIVCGSSNAGVITTDKVIESGIAVLVFGGDVNVAIADAVVDETGEECGKIIGEKIKIAGIPEGSQKLMIMVGDCHHPKNNNIAKGIMSVLGEDTSIVGAAADGPKFVFFKGEVKKNSAIGIMLAGDFKVGYGMETGGTSVVKDLLGAADIATSSAVKECEPELLLLFDCSGRRSVLKNGKAVEKEFEIIKKNAGDAMIFGFYGQGEVGKKNASGKSFGDGYHISACSLSGKRLIKNEATENKSL